MDPSVFIEITEALMPGRVRSHCESSRAGNILGSEAFIKCLSFSNSQCITRKVQASIWQEQGLLVSIQGIGILLGANCSRCEAFGPVGRKSSSLQNVGTNVVCLNICKNRMGIWRI